MLRIWKGLLIVYSLPLLIEYRSTEHSYEYKKFILEPDQ